MKFQKKKKRSAEDEAKLKNVAGGKIGGAPKRGPNLKDKDSSPPDPSPAPAKDQAKPEEKKEKKEEKKDEGKAPEKEPETSTPPDFGEVSDSAPPAEEKKEPEPEPTPEPEAKPPEPEPTPAEEPKDDTHEPEESKPPEDEEAEEEPEEPKRKGIKIDVTDTMIGVAMEGRDESEEKEEEPEEPKPEQKEIICYHCAAPNPEGSETCVDCGVYLNEDDVVDEPEDAPEEEEPEPEPRPKAKPPPLPKEEPEPEPEVEAEPEPEPEPGPEVAPEPEVEEAEPDLFTRISNDAGRRMVEINLEPEARTSLGDGYSVRTINADKGEFSLCRNGDTAPCRDVDGEDSWLYFESGGAYSEAREVPLGGGNTFAVILGRNRSGDKVNAVLSGLKADEEEAAPEAKPKEEKKEPGKTLKALFAVGRFFKRNGEMISQISLGTAGAGTMLYAAGTVVTTTGGTILTVVGASLVLAAVAWKAVKVRREMDTN